MKKLIKLAFIALFISTVFCFMDIKGQQADITEHANKSNYNMVELYKEMRQLVHRYYPQATAYSLNNKIHFEHNTRIFVVHEALKTGEWQDPWEERGPQLGGISADIEINTGHWQGAAMVPQSFDKRYFTAYLMAPYSNTLDAHLQVLIKYPHNVPNGFLKELTDLLNNFDKLVTKTAPE